MDAGAIAGLTVGIGILCLILGFVAG